jgi:hypothetical protein
MHRIRRRALIRQGLRDTPWCLMEHAAGDGKAIDEVTGRAIARIAFRVIPAAGRVSETTAAETGAQAVRPG